MLKKNKLLAELALEHTEELPFVAKFMVGNCIAIVDNILDTESSTDRRFLPEVRLDSFKYLTKQYDDTNKYPFQVGLELCKQDNFLLLEFIVGILCKEVIDYFGLPVAGTLFQKCLGTYAVLHVQADLDLPKMTIGS